MSARTSRWAWIGERRGNKTGPLGSADLATFRVIGVILILVSLAVVGYYGLEFDIAAYTTFRGELRTARGVVTAVEPTGWHEPGTKRSRRDERTEIDAVQYTFVDANRAERQGRSYRPNVRLTAGAPVTVEHPVGRPDVSRIRGYRTAKFDTVPPAVGILAGVGVALLVAGLALRGRVARREGR